MTNKLAKKPKAKSGVEGEDGKYILQLFVAGVLPNSARAIENIHAICEKHLAGRYELEVIDIYQQPAMAVTHQIIAIPSLIKISPLPGERLIGDLSNTERVLRGLHLV